MKKKIKVMLVLSLLLLFISCSKEKNNSKATEDSKVQEEKIQEDKTQEQSVQEQSVQEQSVQEQKKLSKGDALEEYLQKGSSEGYTETEMLTELFTFTFVNIKQDAENLKGPNHNYENLNKIMEDFKAGPNYDEAIAIIVDAGYNKEEAEIFFKSSTAVAVLYNEYTDKGIDIVKEAKDVIEKDERMQTNLKDIASVTRSATARLEK